MDSQQLSSSSVTGIKVNNNNSFSQENLKVLLDRIQKMQAEGATETNTFKLISRNIPIPPQLEQAMLNPELVQTLIPMQNDFAANYNDYINPHSYYHKPTNAYVHAFHNQKLLVPSITPIGFDPVVHAVEQEKALNAKINQRILELKHDLMINNINKVKTEDGLNHHHQSLDNLKLKEYKILNLIARQKKLRNDIFFAMSRKTRLISTVDRASCRNMKRPSMMDSRITESLEIAQREDRERKEKQKHINFLQSICIHGRNLAQWHRTNNNKQLKLGRSVLNYHAQVEKEEQKRAERISKERLRALKDDDEEAYLKLIDKAKDTRITHLLKQTNAYLDSLAQAVVAQQSDELHNDPSVRGVDYYKVAHKISEEVEQPSIMEGGTLKDYQVKGLQWMVSLYNNRLNGILADEMGLGKTIQTISLITYLIERKRQNGPFLIVVPLSTLTNWTMEFDKWAPLVRKCVYKGTPAVRKELQQQYTKHINFQVLLTTYEYIIRDKAVLSKIRWVYVIIDEGHRMKNVNSKLSMILTNNYQCRYRLILTGTPLQNNLPELWSLLNFILPKIFDSVKSFDEWFNTPFANTGGQDKIALNEEESLLIIRRLHKVLRPFLLRRLKKDVESELPDKIERVIKCKLSALQLKLYNQMKKLGVLFVNTGEKGKTGIKGLNNTIMQLRKICNHPFVFEEVEKDVNPYLNNDLLYRASGKFELLDRILPKFYKTNHRYLRLDGMTKAEDRSELLKKFNAPDSPYFIFLLSTRAGGLGLNLQSADTVVIFDSDWNPHQDLQAQDRAHRIGQTREVRILRLISQKSIEETILARAQFKLDIDGKVIQAGKFDNKSTAEEREAFLNEEREWYLKGGEGKKPERLIEENELPSVYMKDYETVINYGDDDNIEYGRGQRVRGNVHYDDGLTEDQWALEDEEIELDDLIAKKQATKKRRLEKKVKRTITQQPEEEPSQQGSTSKPNVVYSDEMMVVDNMSDSKKKRGRPRKDESLSFDKISHNNNNSDLTLHKLIKKKGKAKREFGGYDEQTNDETFSEQTKKKRKISKKKNEEILDDVPPQNREKMRKIFIECYSEVDNLMDVSNGEPRHRAYLFLTLPKIRDYPLYYQIITNPIAMDTIKKRLKGIYYKTVQQFKEDWHLMFNNARAFNEEGSQIYNDADKMQEVLDKKLEELCPGGELPKTSTDDMIL
ncbi:4086_t:CDS:10 [Entrophospora sp. SA101]|nr:4086_t:CDS:10 [Entrophospora sp. SA101]